MPAQLKPIEDQTIVITGASSGIGLATARRAARCGANVVLASRNEQALSEAVDQIRAEGGEASSVVVDVADQQQVRQLAEEAERRHGTIDTWVNNASTAIFGRLLEVPIEDQRRLFEVNYWGMVYGSLTAADRMEDSGGAIINIGSVLSERAFPLQGPYSAAKHAVKGFTDTLRMELEEKGLPISVSLIKPSAIHTLYEDHARSYLSRPPKNPPPYYAPQTVARAILFCAMHPRREVTVGLAGKMIEASGRWMPRFTDRLLERLFIPQQMASQPDDYAKARRDNLYEPRPEGEERGHYPHYTQPVSLYTEARLRPWTTLGVLAGLASLGAAGWYLTRSAAAGDGRRGEPHEIAPPPPGFGREVGARPQPTPSSRYTSPTTE